MSTGQQKASIDDLLSDQQHFHASAINELRMLRKTAESIADSVRNIEKATATLLVLSVIGASIVALSLLF